MTTHADLVDRAERWLRNIVRCQPVLTELVALTQTGEIPDAIGWCADLCYVVECKTSRADMRRDLHKSTRKPGHAALGNYRFYLAPKDIIHPADIPDGWGLYEVDGRSVVHRCGEAWAVPRIDLRGKRYWTRRLTRPNDSHIRDERALLISALRRKALASRTLREG